MKRQGLVTTLNELRKMYVSLEKEAIERRKNVGIYEEGGDCLDNIFEQRIQINIINKTPKCSDTWEFEK